MLNVTGHARLQASLRLAQLAKQASVAASANRSLASFRTEAGGRGSEHQQKQGGAR